VYVVDHKFLRAMTRDAVEGYAMDGQFLLMSLLWKRKRLEKVYGPLLGFIINVVTKTKVPECKRLEVVISDEDVLRFEETIRPVVVELQSRLDAPHKNELDNWPMNFAVCKNPRGFGLCPFWDLCASHGKLVDLYEISPWSGKKKPSALL
jgi:hypothetical protein